ncbi:hypothetical protein D3C72_2331540 [compost metagenome]
MGAAILFNPLAQLAQFIGLHYPNPVLLFQCQTPEGPSQFARLDALVLAGQQLGYRRRQFFAQAQFGAVAQ